MKKTTFLLTTLTLLIAGQSATAAVVPEGVKLRAKQEIVINNGAEPASLDPHKVEGIPEAVIIRQLFEGLVVRDQWGNIQAGTATEWHSNEDFTRWTFKLREAKWSNGDPLSADDFVYAWQRLADPKTASPYASYLEKLKLNHSTDIINGKKSPTELGIQALDAHTLQLNLSSPVPYLPAMLVSHALVPIHKASVDKFGDKWIEVGHFVGNGAYTLAERVLNEKLVFTRNAHYWNDKETVINKATLLSLASANADVARYRANDLDMTSTGIPADLYPKLKAELADQLYTTRTIATYFYAFNNAKAPFNDIRVRKALNLALQRDIITDKVLGMGQTPTYTHTPNYIGEGEKIQSPAYAKLSQAERNQQAIELLKEAGFDKQNPLKFNLLYNTSENHKKIAIAVISMWKANTNGAVQVSLENQEWKTFLATRNQGLFDVSRSAWQGEYNNPTAFQNNFLTNSSYNDAFFSNAAYDALIESSYYAKTAEERSEIYAKAEQAFMAQYPIVPVYNSVNVRLVKPYVKGFTTTDPQDYYYIRNLYLTE
ncbi:oligopeptide ABC transporter substrate-binding protein OppA [Muribacter muris]|uniref:Oligopeptide ABC transporter substrate-binding protein OppA n=1 Tax=Muribacter muris TaxID=67855 RepID=A0A4Y9K1M1_9PAST|nr:ABC transporter substrate-binding protein [Muribacter muris]MBF0784813.1 oligopeptide ABC transporter substrate-binding protein OppA [Muribacter muris]MBF0826628.1 oligopeptide ABC transporter substrate-binding protein OppA [Muribacter muris]TFV11049.1 oligopeptide ABC transporter substrate-binding protein OppA [Muribacter muris]